MVKKKLFDSNSGERFVNENEVPDFEADAKEDLGLSDKVEILGELEDRSNLKCGSCTNPVTGTNSLNHANFHIVESDDKTVILCSDCDRKFKANPQITPAFYVQRQEGKLIERRWE